jgi:hypothetical protein
MQNDFRGDVSAADRGVLLAKLITLGCYQIYLSVILTFKLFFINLLKTNHNLKKVHLEFDHFS